MLQTFSKNSNFNKDGIIYDVNNFGSEGILFGDGQRNKIKLFELEGKAI